MWKRREMPTYPNERMLKLIAAERCLRRVEGVGTMSAPCRTSWDWGADPSAHRAHESLPRHWLSASAFSFAIHPSACALHNRRQTHARDVRSPGPCCYRPWPPLARAVAVSLGLSDERRQRQRGRDSHHRSEMCKRRPTMVFPIAGAARFGTADGGCVYVGSAADATNEPVGPPAHALHETPTRAHARAC